MNEFVSETGERNFESEVLQSSLPVLVDFWATWCAPCRMLSPVIDTIAEQYHGKVKVLKVNVDDNPALSAQYGIKAIPTLLLFTAGAVREQLVGNTSQGAIVKMLDNHLSE